MYDSLLLQSDKRTAIFYISIIRFYPFRESDKNPTCCFKKYIIIPSHFKTHQNPATKRNN